MNIFDRAFEILKKFVPGLTPDSFKVLTYNPNKSREDNKEIMIKEIAEGKLGPLLQLGAEWLQKHRPSLEESEKLISREDLDETINQEYEKANERAKQLNQEISMSQEIEEGLLEETAQENRKIIESENT